MHWVFCTLEDLVKLCITHVQERPEHWWPKERGRAAHPRASLRLPRVVHTREHRDGARFRMEADCVTGGVCARMSFLGISAAGWRPGPRHNPVQRVLPSAVLGGRDWSCVNARFFGNHQCTKKPGRICGVVLSLSFSFSLWVQYHVQVVTMLWCPAVRMPASPQLWTCVCFFFPLLLPSPFLAFRRVWGGPPKGGQMVCVIVPLSDCGQRR